MIVMGLDKNTTIPTVKAAFEYITHYKILDVRLVKDKAGVSRGFCFIQWESVEVSVLNTSYSVLLLLEIFLGKTTYIHTFDFV